MEYDKIRNALYEKYISPTIGNSRDLIGVELEMPILNLNKCAVDFKAVHAVTRKFTDNFGFTAAGFDDEGNVFSAQKAENGDILSFDCSYNNLELSFGRANSLNEIQKRFSVYYEFLQNAFKPFGCMLTGMGINPYRSFNNNVPIPNGRYRMLYHHLSTYKKYFSTPLFFHRKPDFGMFSCASQVQLDVNYSDLPLTLNTFSKLEPIKALLFSNSVLLGENEDILCYRDIFWENSTQGLNPHNVGMYNAEFSSADDILSYIETTSIYCVERDGKYINFKPVNIVEYLQSRQVEGEYYENGEYKKITFTPQISDIAYLRTYKFEDLTYRGTVEYRSVCCQPISECLSFAAFQLGLKHKLKELNTLLENDSVIYRHGYTASELRRMFINRKLPAFADPDALYELARNITDLAADGLKLRGLGEEKFLQPVYRRIKNRTNPAREMLDLLDSGESLESIILRFSNAFFGRIFQTHFSDAFFRRFRPFVKQ